MKFFIESLWIGLGAALGANGRYWIGYLCKASIQEFPWPTMLINIFGSLMLGFFSAVALERGWGWQGRLFFAVGVCGGFTTFSTFSFEVIDAYFRRSWKLAAAYAALSLVLCIAGCFAGGHFGRLMFANKPPKANGVNPFAS
ncbi:MAG TPA: fluoride efflux transporter CrcB [Fimbriimonadaceae bacterium]|nr:fluoride efflux transporter CrcB [Fimbriimonadaceae bacterium]